VKPFRGVWARIPWFGRRRAIQLALPFEPVHRDDAILPRMRWVEFAVALMVLVLGARLAQLQVVQGAAWRRAAEENRLRLLRLPAPRGAIYDCKGRLLAGSRPAFWLTATVRSPTDRARLARQLASLLHQSPSELGSRLEEPGPMGPAVVKADISYSELAAVAECGPYLPGVQVQVRPVRFYPRGTMAAHALGYVREISAAELARLKRKGYAMGDLIGKAGIELKFEHVLRGRDGADQVEVDRAGRTARVLGRLAPTPGGDLALSLDARVQAAAEGALKGRTGAVVAMECRTGAVLALASSPNYDANVLVGPLSRQDWAVVNGPGWPQNNRAVQGLYEPGSVFKVVTALAGLQSGAVSPRSRFFCPGFYRVGNHKFRCWQAGGHGSVDFTTAIAQSCNTAFMTIAARVGAKRLARTARMLGLGHKTGIDLPGEGAGLVPSPAWKASRGERWFAGDTCQMGIGQAGVVVTPLQAARMMAAVANGGCLVRPHLCVNPGSNDRERLPVLPQRVLAALRKGLERVVSEGTASSALRSCRVPIAGKTGTAQTASGEPHSWFVGYAPAHDPKVCIAVVVEHGGGGAATAAPLAGRILEQALALPGP